MTYEQALAWTDSVADALGQPVDAQIKPIVAALHMHGIPTTSSCEGHVDGGQLYPWVDIGLDHEWAEYASTVDDPVVNEFAQAVQAAVRQSKKLNAFVSVAQLESGKHYGIDITADKIQGRLLDDASPQEAHELTLQNRKTALQVTVLLDDFYQVHQPSKADARLLLVPMGIFGGVELVNAGSATIAGADKDTVRDLQREYRAEMKAFADFLVKEA